MYNTHSAPVAQHSHTTTESLEQVVFDEFAKYVQQRSGDPVGNYAFGRYSSDRWMNNSSITAVKTIMQLMAARCDAQRVPALQVLPECVRSMYVALTAAMVRNDVQFYNQLPYDVRQQIERDYAFADAVANEIEAWEQMANSRSSYSPANSPNAGGVRSSIYSRLPNGTTPSGPLPKSVTVGTPYMPSRQGGFTSKPQEQPPAARSTGAYLGNRGGSAVVQTTEPSRPVVQERASSQQEPQMAETNKFSYGFNPHTHTDKGKEMDYKNHQPDPKQFPRLTTGMAFETHHIVSIAAGGLVFDPLSLENRTPEERAPDLAVQERVVHYGAQIFASSLAHAELSIFSKMLEQGLAVDYNPFCYEYRDFSPLHIWPNKEAADMAVMTTPMAYLSDTINVVSLHDTIDKMFRVIGTGQLIGDWLNRRATEWINEFLLYQLGLQGWVTTDFYGDWHEIHKTLQREYGNDFVDIERQLEEQTPSLIARTTGSVFLNFETEIAEAIDKWAGNPAETLGDRTLLASDLHAVMRLPMQAVDLGFDTKSLPALLTPQRGCEVFYEATAQFLGRLNEDPQFYRTISIITRDGFQIKLRGTSIAVSPTDDRRAIAVISINQL